MKEIPLNKLNMVQLQAAIYAAFREFDQPKTRAVGRKRILAIYKEYERRGATRIDKSRVA